MLAAEVGQWQASVAGDYDNITSSYDAVTMTTSPWHVLVLPCNFDHPLLRQHAGACPNSLWVSVNCHGRFCGD